MHECTTPLIGCAKRRREPRPPCMLRRSSLFLPVFAAALRPSVRMSATATASEARCFCGAITVTVTGAPAGTSACHCSTCRSLSGAPFLANVLFPRAAVTLVAADGTEAITVDTQTSKIVTRRRCAKCFSPVLAEVSLKQPRAVVPAALFSPLPPGWAPAHHIHYDSRVLDMNDGLPKFRTNYGGTQCDDQGNDLVE